MDLIPNFVNMLSNDSLLGFSKSETSKLPGDFFCAFCLIPLREEDVKKCASCKRRVYCSRECQSADWKTPKEGKPADCRSTQVLIPYASAYGQGHKNWCSIQCGEEGRDWCLKLVDGRPGLVALRNIPTMYRIIVEGFQNHDDFASYAGHEGYSKIVRHKASLPKGVRLQSVQGRGVFGFRTHFANHACDANAHLAWDTEFRVMILTSIKEIKEGEEICFQYEQVLFNNLTSPPPNLKQREAKILAFFGQVCKPDCICKEQEVREALLELWSTKESMEALMEEGKLEEAVRKEKEIPALIDKARLPPQQVAYIDMIRLGLHSARGLPASQLLPHVRKVIEFQEKVYHTQSKFEVLKWKAVEQQFMQNGEAIVKVPYYAELNRMQ